MTASLVSVITPAYNAAPYVGEAIVSVQNQSYNNWEMLIVDDGSPDNTADVVSFYAKDDERIRLITQDNAGPALARQTAINNAKGRYIAFLDSDDCWLPEKLAAQLDLMSRLEAAISYTSFRRINADATVLGHKIQIPRDLTYSQLLGNTAMATSTVIIDREKTGPFRMTRTYYDDFVLWLDILKRGHKAHGLDEDLMRYRVLNQSVSRNKLKSMRMVWLTYRDIEQLSPFVAGWCFAKYAINAWSKYRTF